MSELLQMPLEGGGSLVIRLSGADDEPQPDEKPGPVHAGRELKAIMEDRIVEAQQSLEKALEPIADASRSVLRVLGKVAPEEIEVEFGVEFTAEANAIMAKMGGNSHLNVKLVWRRQDAASDTPAGSVP